MLDVLVVLVVIAGSLLLVAIFIGNELSRINSTLRECLNVLKENQQQHRSNQGQHR